VLVAERISAIVDLGSMRKAEQQPFVGDLLDEVFACNRAALSVTRIERPAENDEEPSRDFDFSDSAIRTLQSAGHKAAKQAIGCSQSLVSVAASIANYCIASGIRKHASGETDC
jgi:hypothetical protein